MEFLADLHPKVVHFPIAILILYSILEIAGIILKIEFVQKSAYLLLAIGILFAVVAVLTGNQAEAAAELKENYRTVLPEQVIADHETYATITLWYFLGLLVLRTYLVLKKKFSGIFKYGFIPLVLAGIYFIFSTGDIGGKLVYEYGVGTKYFQQDSTNAKINLEQTE